jgi:pyruvate dehydrogenase E1 component alpha subunit
VPPELLAAWAARDPIERQEARVASLGVEVEALRAELDAAVETAAAEALAAPMPDPADAAHGVFASGEPEPLGDGRAPWSGFA